MEKTSVFLLAILAFATLAFSAGTMDIRSNPTGATVVATGPHAYDGRTPYLNNNTVAGTYNITLRKDGYETYRNTLVVRNNQTSRLSVNLTRVQNQTGFLRIITNPAAASVYVDNSARGQTPTTLDGVSVGNHSVRLVKAGYQNYTGSVQITSGQTALINVTLRQIQQQNQTGFLRIITNPAAASVYVDNSARGQTPTTLDGVSVGVHSVLLTKANYTNYTRNVNISAGQTFLINVSLSPIRQQRNVNQNFSAPTPSVKSVKMLRVLTTDEQKAYNEAILRLNTMGVGFDISKYEQEIDVNFNTG